MTPDFALSLSFDGLRLLMRGDAGWLLVGEVALDARDMRTALADLRHRGERLAGGPFEAKLLIPNEQIRYLALDGTMVTEEQVRAALDGATPYPVSDLVYDYTKGGGRTYIAAVARETLAEAEGFAREHGITPVSFAAVPEPFTFVGEVVFGPVSTDPLREVVRDPDPVRVVGTAHLPGAPAPAAEEDPQDAGDADAAAPGAADEDDAVEASRETALDPGVADDPPLEAPDGTAPEEQAEASDPARSAAPDEAAPHTEPGDTEPAGAEDGETPPRDAEPSAPEPSDVQAAAADDGLAPGMAAEDVEATESREDEDDERAPPVPFFSTRRAPRDVAETPSPFAAPEAAPEAAEADLMARLSMPPAPDTDPPETGTAAEAATPEAGPDAGPPEAEAAPARPSIFSRAARTPQPGAPADARAGAAHAPDETADPAPEPEPETQTTPEHPAERSEPLPPLPPRRITEAPAPGVATGDTSAPLRIERVAAAMRRPAFLDGLPSPDDPPPPRPSWRETLAQRMRGKASDKNDEPAEEPPEASAKPAAKRPALAFGAVRDREPAPAAPRIGAVPKPAEAPAPGPAASLTAERSSPPGAAVPVPQPDLAARTAEAAPVAADAEPQPPKKATRPRILRRGKAAAASAPTEVSGERARMTVFGARRAEESRAVGGKPRYLGLLLTAILIAAMAIVAAMAGAPEALSRLFAPREAATEIATAPVPPDGGALPDGAPPIAVPAAPGLPIVSPGDRAPAPAEEALAAPEPEAPAAAPEVADSAPEALPIQPAPPETTAAETAAAPPEPAAPRTAPVPIGRVLSPSEAQRIYAATGVWQRAPRIPVTPRLDVETGIAAPASDAPGRPPVPGRPMDLAQTLTDVRIPAPADPPPPGTGFERDARGFILATAEGTLTPDGILVYAGAPPVLPDLRPGTTPPPPDPTDLAPEGAVAEATAGTLVIEAAPELVPPLRPEEIEAEATPELAEAPQAPVEEPAPDAAPDALAETPAGDDGPEAAPAVALVRTPAIVPPVRPASVTARANAETGAETATEETAVAASPAVEDRAGPAVRFLAAPGIVPPVRPAALAPAVQPAALAPEAAPGTESIAGAPSNAATPESPAEAPTDAAAVTPGVAFIETRAIRPPARPADLAPAEPAPAETGAPAATATEPSDAAAPAVAAPRTDVLFVSTRAIDPPVRPGTQPPATAPEAATLPPGSPPVAPLSRPGSGAEADTASADLPVVLVGAPAITPPVRSAGVVARAADRLEAERAAIAARAASVRVVETTPGGVSLASLDPPLRPESILVAARAAAPGPATEAATEVSLRPRARPGELAPESELAGTDDAEAIAEAVAAAAEATAQRNAELVAAAAAAADALGASVPGLATATPRAVASSVRPDARPRNMATLVQRARQQQQRDQARAATAAAPAAAAAAAAPQSTAPTRVEPSGRTSNTVAAAATIDNAINLSRINLIGVYGRLDDRRALVRLSGGRYVRVAVGDRLDGGRVSAIGDGYLTYARGGRNVRLDVPG